MNRPLALSASLALLLAGGCTIIVQPGGNDPAPVPIPGGLQCNTSGDAPSVHIFFDVRIAGRATVTFSPYYRRFMETTAYGLIAAGLVPTEAVLVRLDERPVPNPVLAAWGCNLDNPEDLPPDMVIEHYAKNAALEESPIGCAIDPLAKTGEQLRDIVTQYPPQLPGTSGLNLFGAAPRLVLIVHIDEQARRSSFDDSACARAHDMRGGRWMAYEDGIDGANVVHWFVTTEEGLDRASFVAACKQYEGFPSDTLDLMDASDNRLYGPLASELAGATGRVATLPFCAMLVETELALFLDQEIRAIAEIAGTSINEPALNSVLNGQGLPDLQGMQPGR